MSVQFCWGLWGKSAWELRVLRLEIFADYIYITNQFQTTFAQRGVGGIENPLANVTVNSKEGPRIWPLFNMNTEEEEGYRRGKSRGGGGKLIFLGGG